MATPKVPGNQKLFESMYYTLIVKVTKFQLSTPPPVQNRVNKNRPLFFSSIMIFSGVLSHELVTMAIINDLSSIF